MDEELTWNGWRALDEDARLRAAHRMAKAAARLGRRLGRPELAEFGPPDELELVAIVEDLDLGARFALVPGGRFVPGLDDEGMQAFWAIEHAWLKRLRRRESAGPEGPYTATEWSPEQLQCRLPVDVPPMLVALQPLSAGALGVEKRKSSARPLLTWDAAVAAAARFGYDVPTADELEWATGAGEPSLFYWGDELPTPMDPRDPGDPSRSFEAWEEASADFATAYMGLARSDVAKWPTSNRFGLQGTAGQPVWCRGAFAAPMVAGGADRFFPWQGCGEWLWLLTSLRVPTDAIPGHQGAMVRPVLRLGG